MNTSPDGADEAAARLAEMIRLRAIPSDVKAADEVKRLGLIANDLVWPSRAASPELRDATRKV